MKQHLNILFITREDCYLAKEGDTVKVLQEGNCLIRIPLHNLEGIVTMGWNITISPYLMSACTERKIAISFCNPHGKFLASVQGPFSGNVLLRRAQYRCADDVTTYMKVASVMIAAKIANSRLVLMRAGRTYAKKEVLSSVVSKLASLGVLVQKEEDPQSLRGIEGNAAELYFSVLGHCLTQEEEFCAFEGRSKRPPRDPFNALLSFVYTLLMHDARSALESVGLDSAVGFLHRDRPGRASLALDLMEEFRSVLADRLVLTLFNRKQLGAKDFEQEESGGVFLKEEARKVVLNAWQERKKEVIEHPFLQEKVTVGMLLFIQAQLLARFLRGDTEVYPPFIWR